MKKTTKKVQDTGAVKVIPPYPRWVKICFALVWVLLIVFSLLVGLLEIEDSITIGLVLGVSLLTLSVVSGYGVSRAFKYFPRRAFCVLALLVIVGGILLLLPALIQKRAIVVFQNARGILFLVLGGLTVGQGILALFWKKVRKWGWFIFYTALFSILAITGQVIDYVTRDQVGDSKVFHNVDCTKVDCGLVYHYCGTSFSLYTSLYGYGTCPQDKPFEIKNSLGDGFGELSGDPYCFSCYDPEDFPLDSTTASMPEICPNRVRRKEINKIFGSFCYVMKSILIKE